MISEKALQEAIAECQGTRDPDRHTCMMLAAFFIIQDHMYPKTAEKDDADIVVPDSAYSFLPPARVENTVDIQSDTDFAAAVNGKEAASAWGVMDELMTTLQAVYPRLYDGVLRQIKQL